MEIEITGVPVFYGCDILGVETAPAILRKMGLVERLTGRGHKVTDMGDVAVESIPSSDKYRDHEKMKYVAPILSMCRQVSERVAGALQRGRFPLVIGGDHSDGIGILSGVSRVLGSDTAVLWIDSHSDIHEFATSPSGNVHGVPLGAAIGLPCGSLCEAFAPESNIKGNNIFIIGLRSYEPQEDDIMRRFGVNRYSVDDVRRRGVADIFTEIEDVLKRNGAKALHLSFDIDSLDPSIAPGTGIREQGGLWEDEALEIVRRAFDTGMVRSMDISELNPSRDIDEMTCRLALRIADQIPTGK